jgi:hypothetical protein
MSNEANERRAYYGLLNSQYLDCIRAGRSPKTGRRVRTSRPSALELRAKKVNWAKLQVKGAAVGLCQAVNQMVLRPGEYLELTKTIVKLERLMLNYLTEGYEVTKLSYQRDTDTSKK